MSSLDDIYARQLKYQRSCSAAVTVLMMIIILGGIGVGGYQTYTAGTSKVEHSALQAGLSLSPLIVALIWTYFKYRRIARAQVGSPSISEAPAGVATEVKQTLNRFAQKLGIPLKPVNVAIHKRRFDISPSIWEHRETIDLLLPLGFMKVMKVAPHQAAAMLAHEVGHVRAHDTRHWAIASAFWAVMMRVFLPLNLLLIVGIYGVAVVNHFRLQPETDRQYADALEALDRKYSVEFRYMTAEEAKRAEDALPQVPGLVRIWSYSLDRMMLDHERGRAGVRWGDLAFGSFPFALSTFVLLGYFSSIRSSRRRSEVMADLTAVSLVGARALSECLPAESDKGGRFFRIHPVLSRRRANVMALAAVTGETLGATIDDARSNVGWLSAGKLSIMIAIAAPIYQMVMYWLSIAQPFPGMIGTAVIGIALGLAIAEWAWMTNRPQGRAQGMLLALLGLFLLESHIVLFSLCWLHQAQRGDDFDLRSYVDVRTTILGPGAHRDDTRFAWVAEAVLLSGLGASTASIGFLRRRRDASLKFE